MNRKSILVCFCYVLVLLACGAPRGAGAEVPPNIVLIFLDDSGYADFSPFGEPSYETPHVAELAAEGVRFTRFYVPQAVCSASRAALLSGCHPARTGVVGAHGPGGKGLDPKFVTMAEMLRKRGYATAQFGKWHIGDTPATRPMARGFDEHAGLMISNDMWRWNPVWKKNNGDAPLPYWENGQIKIKDVTPDDQQHLTAWATAGAVRFIRKRQGQGGPFFLYVAHSMPHVPLYCRDEFKGKSGAGLYGDVMLEIDWSVGEILGAIRETGVERNTMVILTSDNGPWEEFGNHAGKTPFREHKGTSFDGGTRSALFVKFPAQLKAGAVNDRAFCSIDLFPTLAHLAGAKLPDYEIDGRNVWPLMRGDEGAANPHDCYVFSIGREMEAVMSGDGKWKLHLPHGYRDVVRPGHDGERGVTRTSQIGMSLFNLERDPMESDNVIGDFPEIAKRLQGYAAEHRKKFPSHQSVPRP
ncbi:MAG: sulfatase [Akkermansiaceae bacterium]|nr:sulfatase [Akkermansiaceae bacterium]